MGGGGFGANSSSLRRAPILFPSLESFGLQYCAKRLCGEGFIVRRREDYEEANQNYFHSIQCHCGGRAKIGSSSAVIGCLCVLGDRAPG